MPVVEDGESRTKPALPVVTEGRAAPAADSASKTTLEFAAAIVGIATGIAGLLKGLPYIGIAAITTIFVAFLTAHRWHRIRTRGRVADAAADAPLMGLTILSSLLVGGLIYWGVVNLHSGRSPELPTVPRPSATPSSSPTPFPSDNASSTTSPSPSPFPSRVSPWTSFAPPVGPANTSQESRTSRTALRPEPSPSSFGPGGLCYADPPQIKSGTDAYISCQGWPLRSRVWFTVNNVDEIGSVPSEENGGDFKAAANVRSAFASWPPRGNEVLVHVYDAAGNADQVVFYVHVDE